MESARIVGNLGFGRPEFLVQGSAYLWAFRRDLSEWRTVLGVFVFRLVVWEQARLEICCNAVPRRVARPRRNRTLGVERVRAA